MAQPSRASFEKRQRERAKRQKRLDKMARRQERKALRESGAQEADGFSAGPTETAQPEDSGEEQADN